MLGMEPFRGRGAACAAGLGGSGPLPLFFIFIFNGGYKMLIGSWKCRGYCGVFVMKLVGVGS